MKVYQTDIDGYFIGEAIADVDPLDPSNMLIPAGCVEVTPIEVPDWAVLRWVSGEWVAEAIPQEVDWDAVPDIPPSDAIRQARNGLLSDSDWTQLADAPVDTAAWATYRQALRDVTDQATFPDSVIWPEEPVT